MLSSNIRLFGPACVLGVLLNAWCAGASAQAVPAPLLDEVQALISAGNAEQAYQKLIAAEDDYAGQPDFDYLLGLAALESGRADAATFAFERVLTVDPSYFGARVDMARAYFQLGNNDLARDEFERLLEQNPPPAAKRTIEAYLDAIKRRESPTQTTWYLEAEAGYDTNANVATSQSNVFVPALNTDVTLDANSSSTEDGFVRAKAGVLVRHKLFDTTLARASASTQYNDFVSSDGFETTDLNVGLGLDQTYGEDTLRYDLSFKHQKLDWDGYQHLLGFSAQWQRVWNTQTQSTVFIQHTRIRYRQADDQSNDSDLNLGGLTLARALDEQGKAVVSGALFGGLDVERNTRIDGGRKLFGARLAAQYRLTDAVLAYGSASYQTSIYDRQNSLFNVRRKDEQASLSLGMSWRPAEGWRLQPSVSVTRNDSNVPFNEYERLQAGLTVRREF